MPPMLLVKGWSCWAKARHRRAATLARAALDNGASNPESFHVVVEGARRLLEVSEQKATSGELVGFAIDRTEKEELQAELNRHIRVQAEVLENLGTAIAIFGQDLRLAFFNSAYARLWDIDDSYLPQ